MAEAAERAQKASVSRYCEPVKEITEEQYNEALNILPPEDWQHGSGWSAFRMCEYMSGNITGHYMVMDGRHFFAFRPAGRNTYTELAAEIRKAFNL